MLQLADVDVLHWTVTSCADGKRPSPLKTTLTPDDRASTEAGVQVFQCRERPELWGRSGTLS
jgi:hypothetical protein